MSNYQVVEVAEGTFQYHLIEMAEDGTHNSKAICGRDFIMPTHVPLSAWGVQSHLREQWCTKCRAISKEGAVVQEALLTDEYVSYQGTGTMLGVQQYFVRFAGCNVPCPLMPVCDEPDALTVNNAIARDINDIVISAKNAVGPGGWLHVTGGEPLEQPVVVQLVDLAMKQSLQVQVQTSGTRHVTWISTPPFMSVSPKNRSVLIQPDELILVASNWMTDSFALDVTEGAACPIYVIPEAIKGNFSSERMLEVVALLRTAGRNALPALQSHLLWGVK